MLWRVNNIRHLTVTRPWWIERAVSWGQIKVTLGPGGMRGFLARALHKHTRHRAGKWERRSVQHPRVCLLSERLIFQAGPPHAQFPQSNNTHALVILQTSGFLMEIEFLGQPGSVSKNLYVIKWGFCSFFQRIILKSVFFQFKCGSRQLFNSSKDIKKCGKCHIFCLMDGLVGWP